MKSVPIFRVSILGFSPSCPGFSRLFPVRPLSGAEVRPVAPQGRGPQRSHLLLQHLQESGVPGAASPDGGLIGTAPVTMRGQRRAAA